MGLPSTSTNNVKVYTVTGSSLSRKLPDWLARRKRRELQKDVEWTSRVELLQDFEFPEASLKIKTTADGNFCMATGVYKPQMRVFEFSDLSMKFDRHTDSENVDFQILSDDWTKSVHLQTNRAVEFHNEGQMHYRVRIPRFGRSLAYHSPSCDVLVGGAGNEVFRVNIDQGRFMTPMATQARGVNVVRINPAHQLFGFGLENGGVEFWDPRVRTCIGSLAPHANDGAETSALAFRQDGLGAAVGTSAGHVLLYDLRQARPWQIKDQRFGLPVRVLDWLEPVRGVHVEAPEARVLSADARSIKLWGATTGKPFAAIEPAAAVNDVCVVPDSGLLLVAGEAAEMQSYFVPQLGPAPRWASFLENLTEEMESTAQQHSVYDDYKFVTRRELDSLGLAHLVGSNVLKPYMHGFFVDLRLYERAKAIANPFAYEEYRLRRVQEKLAEARESRIRATTKLPKVNRALAQRLLKLQKNAEPTVAVAVAAAAAAAGGDEDEEEKRLGGRQRKKAKAAAETASAVLGDDRFKAMFANPDFEVDEEEPEFKQLHTTSTRRQQKEMLARSRTNNADAADSSDDEVDIRRMAVSAAAGAAHDDDASDDDANSDDDFYR
ncbi:Small ribosomal subunit biogenesis [Coemansia asiatica]|nr:Small ribosomal subunit biogenesis [Coemansia asiatica]